MGIREEGKQKPSKWPLYLSIALLGTLIILYFSVASINGFFNEAWKVLTSGDQQYISDWVAQFSWWGPLIIILAIIVQMFLLVIPTPLLMVVTVVAYGPFAGTAIVLIAIFMASSVAYGTGAYFGTPVIERLLGARSERKVKEFLEQYGFWAIIIFRLSPFLSNDAVSFVAGILRMGYRRFIFATMLGIFPLTLIIAYLGENNERLVDGMIWLSILSLIGFLAYIWWGKNRKTKRVK